MNTNTLGLFLSIFILLLIYILWYTRRGNNTFEHLSNINNYNYDDEHYQSVTKTFLKKIVYKKNIKLQLYPNELFKNIKLPYLFPDFVIMKKSHNSLFSELIHPNNIKIIQNDLLLNISNISIQKSIQNHYNIPINKDFNQKITTICNSNLVSYTLLSLSKSNMKRYSDIFGKKIGVFGSQAIWSLFFVYQIFGKSFDLSNIVLYNNENQIKKDYIEEKIIFIFMVTTHPSLLCNDIFLNTDSIILDINTEPEITLDKIQFFISETAFIKEIDLTSYNLGNLKIPTITIRSTFTTHKDSDKTLIYLFTKYFYDTIPYYKNYIKSMTNIYQWSLIPITSDIDIHPGSKKFFIEKGLIIISDSDDKQQSNKINNLIETKYGDSSN
jgi:hypothetical protein